jgi:LuxR family maltose regulon positive regulatory protein
MSSNLLATKLYIPPLRKNLVPRLRLIQVLNEAWQSNKKLSLISAPAGYGKTTLASEWLGGLQVDTSWLSLDKADNDPTRFLVYLIAALQQIDRRIGEQTGMMLQSGQPLPTEILLTALINEINGVSTPFILVLDDYHVIEAIQIHQELEFLVDHQPRQMHLVIITREDPPLPLPRLRARGQMVEIRQDDLRFSMDECSDLLNQVMRLNLSRTDIAALERRTEGWVAGLQLAALSMRGRDDLTGFIQAFTGSSHYVLDYLIEEVFKQQPADVQDFLLKTSILDRLSGPLCDAVANWTNSRDLLEHLEHANLFIVPLDQSCSWYRYHRLFAELLRQRLHATNALSENNLHRLASQWFANQGFIPEAIHHTLQASDWDRAAALISENAVSMLRSGELVTLLSWLKALPNEVIFTHPDLCQNCGWALTLTGQLDAAEVYLQQAENIAREDEALLGPILVARAYHLRVRGDIPLAIDYAHRALSILPQTDALSRGLAALTLGLTYWNIGDYQESEQAFLEVDRAAQQSGNHYARLTALTYLGNIQAVNGHLHRAAEFCQQVIQLGGQSPTVAPAHIGLASLFYEWNQLDLASKEALIGIE